MMLSRWRGYRGTGHDVRRGNCCHCVEAIQCLVAERERLLRGQPSSFLMQRGDGCRTKTRAPSRKHPVVFVPGRWRDRTGEGFALGRGCAEKSDASVIV